MEYGISPTLLHRAEKGLCSWIMDCMCVILSEEKDERSIRGM